MSGTPVPNGLIERVTASFGPLGGAWLEDLPGLVAEAADRWKVRLDPPFADLSYSYVAPGVLGGRPVVLKARVPDEESRMEAPALRHFSGSGGVRLLEADEARGLLLLERLLPGTRLAEEPNDDLAAAIAANLMEELWQAPGASGFISVAEWTRAIPRHRARFGGSGAIPSDIFERAEDLRAELLVSSPEVNVILHGDLHHYNILRSADGWKAIDPRGIRGEPAFEAGPFLDNPRQADSATLKRRIEILCERLSLDRRRVAGWGVVYGILSACWTLESADAGWERAVELSRRLLEASYE